MGVFAFLCLKSGPQTLLTVGTVDGDSQGSHQAARQARLAPTG